MQRTLDVPGLAAAISGIREALRRSPHPQTYAGPEIPAEDRHELLRRLQQTVTAARSRDLRVLLRTDSGGLTDPEWGLRLGNVFNELRVAQLDRLLRHLGQDGPVALGSLLEDPAPEFLTILGKATDEVSHSAVIGWLLDPGMAPTVAPALLHGLVGTLPDATSWLTRLDAAVRRRQVSVRREVLAGRETADPSAADRIDILVSGCDFSLAIENKIGTQEHDEQTTTYWHWLEMLPAGILRAGFFLTRDGSAASCKEFRPLSYVEFLGLLVQASRGQAVGTRERAVLAGYVKALATGVLGCQIRSIRGM